MFFTYDSIYDSKETIKMLNKNALFDLIPYTKFTDGYNVWNVTLL